MAAKKDKEKDKSKSAEVLKLLGDPSVSADHRFTTMMMMAHDDSDTAKEIKAAVLEVIEKNQGDEVAAAKAKELGEVIQQIELGPLRYGTFVEMVETKTGFFRARVTLEDGADAYVVVPDAELAPQLVCGDTVLLEAQGRALLYRIGTTDHTGESGWFERRVGKRKVEVRLRGDERHFFRVSAELMEKLEKGEVPPGSQLIVNTRQRFSFDVVPPVDGLSHYRYLLKSGPPDVLVERDIACPPAFIEELADTVRTEMLHPERRRAFGLRRCKMLLLAGASGAGKTLSVYGTWRRMYEVMSEVTGVPIEQLPPRVLRLRMAEVLNSYLGESDKNLDRFFTEAEQLADELYTAPDGTQHKLPVIVFMEEIEALGRARGQDRDGIYDRIMTTALQRLDPTRPELKDKLIIFIATTNLEQELDVAFFRRTGGRVVKFGRLNRKSFAAVLNKLLQARPLSSNNGYSQDQLKRQLVSEVTLWLFSPNGDDKGVLELTYHGSTAPDVRFKRDLLTAALVDRAVDEAANEACRLAHNGSGDGEKRIGLTTGLLATAFDQQIRSVVEQVNQWNAANYLTVPDGVNVAKVKRIPQAWVNPFELQRADTTNHNPNNQ